MLSLTVLSTADSRPATKRYSRSPNGKVEKRPPFMSALFTGREERFDGIEGLAALLTSLAAERSSFIIRGAPAEHLCLDAPFRRLLYDQADCPATIEPTQRQWICLDFDGIPTPLDIDPLNNSRAAFLYLASLLPRPFAKASFVGQWSGSAGVNGWATLRAHLWFVLTAPASDTALNTWAKSCGAPVDPRLFHPVQPHFTATPIFEDMPDPISDRVTLIRRERDAVELNLLERPHHANDRRRVSTATRGYGIVAAWTRAEARIGRATA